MFYYKVIHKHGTQWIEGETLQPLDSNKSLTTTLLQKRSYYLVCLKSKGGKAQQTETRKSRLGDLANCLLFHLRHGSC